MSELVDIGDKSEVSYVFDVLDSTDETRAFPVHETVTGRTLTFPRVSTSDDGSRYLSEYELSAIALAALEEAEPHFGGGDYDAALAIYRRAVELDPECYILHSHIGDCFLRTGQPQKALASYEKALSLNTFDFRTYWFMGDALLELGEQRKARNAYVQALALRPSYPPLLDVIKSRASKLAIDLHDERFNAPAGARQEKDRVVVVAPEAQYWQLYGLCHAIWLGEAAHRERMTGKEEHNWTSEETMECLLILLEAYDRFGPLADGPRDPVVERLERIHGRGYLEEFVYYELGAQGLYAPILLAPDGFRARMEEYVAEFVLVDRKQGVSRGDSGD